jgi:hypothetical protein
VLKIKLSVRVWLVLFFCCCSLQNAYICSGSGQ